VYILVSAVCPQEVQEVTAPEVEDITTDTAKKAGSPGSGPGKAAVGSDTDSQDGDVDGEEEGAAGEGEGDEKEKEKEKEKDDMIVQTENVLKRLYKETDHWYYVSRLIVDLWGRVTDLEEENTNSQRERLSFDQKLGQLTTSSASKSLRTTAWMHNEQLDLEKPDGAVKLPLRPADHNAEHLEYTSKRDKMYESWRRKRLLHVSVRVSVVCMRTGVCGCVMRRNTRTHI